jgi:hypothetical protein
MHFSIFSYLQMAQNPPTYKLKDEHVVTAKHMRDERVRNDAQYKLIA